MDTMITASDHASLAAELATKLLPVPEVMARHGLDAAEMQRLLADPQFKNMISEFRRDWEAPMSARERVRLKSALAVEDGLVTLYAIFKDIDLTPTARIDAFKQLVGLAEMGPKKDGAESGPAFNLTLNLGGETNAQKTLTIAAATTEAESEADGVFTAFEPDD